MEWNKENLKNIVEFINKELLSGTPMVRIEKEEFGENERVIHKRLIRLGYKKMNNQYILIDNITSNITDGVTCNLVKDDNKNKRNIFKEEKRSNEIDEIKLKILIDNIDDLLKLVKSNNEKSTSNITEMRSGITDVKSFRIDTGIYAAVKRIAHKKDENIGEVINKALEEFLIKYKL